MKLDLFRELGYGGEFDLLEVLLQDAGLSRPSKGRIAESKREAVRALLGRHVLAVCNRGDCQNEAAEVDDGRLVVPAASQGDCAICGGSANGRAVDEMVRALREAGLGRLCVIGGSPNARTELQRLIRGRIEVLLIDGTVARTRKQAEADLAWADRVAVWGGTMLDHKVSALYHGKTVIQFARRSIQELAREVRASCAP